MGKWLLKIDPVSGSLRSLHVSMDRSFALIRAAFLTSAATVLADDPRLNCRQSPFQEKSIRVAILDRDAQTASFLKSSQLLKLRAPAEVFVFTAPENLRKFPTDLGVKLKGLTDLKSIVQALWNEGVHSVLVEGGPRLTSAFLAQGLFHRLHLFMGNKIIGTSAGQGWAQDVETSKLDLALRLERMSFQTLGDSILISGLHPQSFAARFR